jgi:hypothetical protein
VQRSGMIGRIVSMGGGTETICARMLVRRGLSDGTDGGEAHHGGEVGGRLARGAVLTAAWIKRVIVSQ